MTAKLVRPLLSGFFDRTGDSLGMPYLNSFSGKEITIKTVASRMLENKVGEA